MHAILHILAATTTTTAGTKKTSGSSPFSLLIPLVLVAGLYLLFIRPRSKKARQTAQQQKTFDVGDDVVSIGGITGHVVGVDDDEVRVEVASGVVLTFLRRAVNLRNPAPPVNARGAAGGAGGFFRPRQPTPVTDPYESRENDDEFAGHDLDADASSAEGPVDAASESGGAVSSTEAVTETGPGSDTSASDNGASGTTPPGDESWSRRRRDKRPGRGGGGGTSAGGR